MTGAPNASPKPPASGLRALATNYRTRLLLAILLVVAVALLLVLLSLPRLLDPYFGGQELRNLQSRAETMATLIASELDQAAREGTTHPLLQPDGSATFTTLGTLGDEEGGYVRELTDDIALADVSVQVARSGATELAHRLDIAFPDEAAEPGQGREAIAASASAEVDDVFYAPSSDVSPSLRLTVTLSNPFTFREETARTITEVLITAALIALVVALITALLLAQWLARPLRRLTKTSRLLAEGHLDARVDMPSNSAPEVQELAGAFNDMADRLQESVAIISEDRDRGREFLRQSRQQVERLDWLSANLLELSKLDSGLVALQLRDADLRSVVEDAVEHAEPMAERKGVTVRAILPADPVVQPHDPPRLGQVLGNLVGNAIKFTPSGGHVDVSVEATESGAVFEVKDDGVGIDADELPHVFDRFYRGTRTPEERAAGSGLGLAIARSIVDMHRGRVSISSKPDDGTEVLVTLPRDVSLSSPTDAPS